ncbi:MAG: ISL3 family transposase [Acidimicrobiales bacterium]|nr:ISL3 family transposase [Acidimicrobiales bacterium]
MIIDPTRLCELLVGLGEITVRGAVGEPGGPVRVHIETRTGRPRCAGCGGAVWVKDQRPIELVDLPAFGRPARLVWHKRRWVCPAASCPVGSFTETATHIAAARLVMTDRAGRWVTEQVGRHKRSVNEVAVELGCDWHTINDTVIAYGTPLVEDPDRIGDVDALGLDETLFARLGRWRHQHWSTSIVDVRRGQLLDVIPGRSAAGACEWLAGRDQRWLDAIRFAVLDLSGPWRLAFDTMLPDATQVADPFHVCKLANQRLDEVRRRVQNETLGHRGRKHDPLYRSRRLLTRADERLDDRGREKLVGLLQAGDPKGEVRMAWHAKEVVRQIYDHTDPDVGLEFVIRLGADLQDDSCPPEVRQLGRTITRWRHQIAAWHRAHVSNGPTEAANNLIKVVKRIAFGFTSFRNYRIRTLLYAGRPNWDLLPTVTPTTP